MLTKHLSSWVLGLCLLAGCGDDDNDGGSNTDVCANQTFGTEGSGTLTVTGSADSNLVLSGTNTFCVDEAWWNEGAAAPQSGLLLARPNETPRCTTMSVWYTRKASQGDVYTSNSNDDEITDNEGWFMYGECDGSWETRDNATVTITKVDGGQVTVSFSGTLTPYLDSRTGTVTISGSVTSSGLLD